MQKPRILVTLDHTYKPVERLFINLAYLRAIEEAGGEPILIARPDEEAIIHAVEDADGVLFSGGDDVDPPHYGQEKRACLGKCDPTGRDHVELTIAKHAHAKQIPILGICRGLQMLNVFHGGTLYQDITHEMPNSKKHDCRDTEDNTPLRSHRAHDVDIEQDSLLHKITGATSVAVNSLHHQGIERLAPNLRASAHAHDGLVEGIELPGYPFFLGVQWHPEELKDEASLKIFRAFINATNK